MKIIKHWWVKLYQHSQQSPLMSIASNGASGGGGVLKRLIAEGYSKDKVTLPHRDEFIELLTDPYGAELTTFRADVVDSIVCTPVYEDETELNPPRNEMLEYIKTAIGEGYHPEHVAAVLDLAIIDGLNDGDLNREFGKCWQWYNLGGGIHETYAPKDEVKADSDAVKVNVHDHACVNCFIDKGPCLGDCHVTDVNRARSSSFEDVVKPVIKWLNENANPHASVIVDCTSAELLTGGIGVHTEEFLKD